MKNKQEEENGIDAARRDESEMIVFEGKIFFFFPKEKASKIKDQHKHVQDEFGLKAHIHRSEEQRLNEILRRRILSSD